VDHRRSLATSWIVRWLKRRVRRRDAVPDNWFDDIEPDELAG
jgi:hypothetical protein